MSTNNTSKPKATDILTALASLLGKADNKKKKSKKRKAEEGEEEKQPPKSKSKAKTSAPPKAKKTKINRITLPQVVHHNAPGITNAAARQTLAIKERESKIAAAKEKAERAFIVAIRKEELKAFTTASALDAKTGTDKYKADKFDQRQRDVFLFKQARIKATKEKKEQAEHIKKLAKERAEIEAAENLPNRVFTKEEKAQMRKEAAEQKKKEKEEQKETEKKEKEAAQMQVEKVDKGAEKEKKKHGKKEEKEREKKEKEEEKASSKLNHEMLKALDEVEKEEETNKKKAVKEKEDKEKASSKLNKEMMKALEEVEKEIKKTTVKGKRKPKDDEKEEEHALKQAALASQMRIAEEARKSQKEKPYKSARKLKDDKIELEIDGNKNTTVISIPTDADVRVKSEMDEELPKLEEDEEEEQKEEPPSVFRGEEEDDPEDTVETQVGKHRRRNGQQARKYQRSGKGLAFEPSESFYSHHPRGFNSISSLSF